MSELAPETRPACTQFTSFTGIKVQILREAEEGSHKSRIVLVSKDTAGLRWQSLVDYQYYRLRVVDGGGIKAEDLAGCGRVWKLLAYLILPVFGRRCLRVLLFLSRRPFSCRLLKLMVTVYPREQVVTFCDICLGDRRDLLTGLEGEECGADVQHRGLLVPKVSGILLLLPCFRLWFL